MFPFHALTTALRLIMVDPHFGTSDNATNIGLTFLMIPVQKVVTDIKIFMLVQFSELV
jgi:hypothetical protein